MTTVQQTTVIYCLGIFKVAANFMRNQSTTIASALLTQYKCVYTRTYVFILLNSSIHTAYPIQTLPLYTRTWVPSTRQKLSVRSKSNRKLHQWCNYFSVKTSDVFAVDTKIRKTNVNSSENSCWGLITLI